MTENVCVTCQYYESCNRPERFMKCMGYKENRKGVKKMHSRLEDDAQYEWCRQWEEEHRRKITRKKQKKIRRVQHWCNCKLYIKYAWYEFRAMVKG